MSIHFTHIAITKAIKLMFAEYSSRFSPQIQGAIYQPHIGGDKPLKPACWKAASSLSEPASDNDFAMEAPDSSQVEQISPSFTRESAEM